MAVTCLSLTLTSNSVLAGAPGSSLLPKIRPWTQDVIRASKPPQKRENFLEILSGKTRRMKGSVCGVAEIKGTQEASVKGQFAGCGISQPVRITSVSGVRLEPHALVDCTTAKALNDWVKASALPRFSAIKGGLVQMKVAASYSCRPRNDQKGAKLSEHSYGHAIDLSEFVLSDGSRLSVLKDWSSQIGRKPLRAIHSDACAHFGTVLGPNANRFHKDHFHFDTARYRKGAFCR